MEDVAEFGSRGRLVASLAMTIGKKTKIDLLSLLLTEAR